MAAIYLFYRRRDLYFIFINALYLIMVNHLRVNIILLLVLKYIQII